MAKWFQSENNVEILAQLADVKQAVLDETASSIVEISKEHKETLFERMAALEKGVQNKLDAELVARENLEEDLERQLKDNYDLLDVAEIALKHQYETFRRTLKRRQISMAKCLVAELKKLSSQQLELIKSKSHELDKAQVEVKALLAEYKQLALSQYEKVQAQANSAVVMAMNSELAQKQVNKKIKYAFMGIAIAQIILVGAFLYGKF